jgi:hypothetical protein
MQNSKPPLVAIVRAIICMVVAAAQITAYSAGLLTDGRYEDDFEGGPFIDGWDPGFTTVLGQNEYLGPASFIQSPYTPETLYGTSDALIHVEFDMVPYDSFALPPDTVIVDFTTISQGIGYTGHIPSVAKRMLGVDGMRYSATIPFSSIPREFDAPGAPVPRQYGIRVSGLSRTDNESFGVDNFVIDWSHHSSDETLSWDFSAPDLPAGWVTYGYAGVWKRIKSIVSTPHYYNVTYYDGLAAVQDGTEPYEPLEEGSNPELRIDAWTPEFRFSDIASAVFSVDLTAIARNALNDRVYIDLYKKRGPDVPWDDQSPVANFLTFDLSEVTEIPGNSLSGVSVVNVLQDGFDGIVPDNHVDGETVYSIRTRVFDNDLQLESFEFVEIDNMTLTNAVLHNRGDYNYDGTIDGADFLKWQRQNGATATFNLGADGNGDGVVNSGDLGMWASKFGQTFASLAGSTSAVGSTQAAIPEPLPITLAVVGSIAGWPVLKGLRRPSAQKRHQNKGK